MQVSHWKKEARSGRRKFYSREPSHNAESAKERERERFEEIGQLKMEMQWLK